MRIFFMAAIFNRSVWGLPGSDMKRKIVISGINYSGKLFHNKASESHVKMINFLPNLTSLDNQGRPQGEILLNRQKLL